MKQIQEEVPQVTFQSRFFYLDKLRIVLTILVILHHAAIAYGGTGDWAITEAASDSISPIIFTIFNAVNQSFFMSAFFLLAGYFTPRSYEQKGSFKFMKDRLVRLGIPLALYTPIIVPINMYIIQNFAIEGAQRMTFLEILQYQYTHFRITFGHLWFLLVLLIFTVIYVIFRGFTARYYSQKTLHIFRDKFPPNKIFLLSIALLSILTFAIRLVSPVGEWFLFIQFAHIINYTFCFYCGILAYRGDWFKRISNSNAKNWGLISLFTILLAPLIILLGGALESGNYDVFMGGLTWQALIYAIWESILLIGLLIWLIHTFREKITYQGKVIKFLTANVYTVYIIHQPILIILNVAFLPIVIPTVVKFFLVSLITVPLCFILSHFFFRKIPYAKHVLG